MATVTLTVNAVRRELTVAGDTPLLYVLRNDLALSSPRLGCGLGQCGACAVLVDGRAVRSCITPVSSVTGKRIHTVEGLPQLWAEKQGRASAPSNPLHPVQQAWIEEQAAQCGYCQSGMMINAVALLDRTPKPTVEQIKDAFTNTPPSPHLCRCGTYGAILQAVRRAAEVMTS